MTGLLPVRFTGNRLAIYFTSVRQTNVSAMKCTKTKQNRVRFLREWSKPSISRRICQSFAKQFFHYMSAKTWEAPLPPSPLSFSLSFSSQIGTKKVLRTRTVLETRLWRSNKNKFNSLFVQYGVASTGARDTHVRASVIYEEGARIRDVQRSLGKCWGDRAID